MTRCGKCGNCLTVELVKQRGLYTLASEPGVEIGEDVRLIWNRTLEENPCTAGDYPDSINFDQMGSADLPPKGTRRF